MKVRIAAVAVLVFSVACGDDKNPTPTAPTVTPPVTPPPVVTPPAATLTDLSLKGPSWFVDNPVLEIGESVNLNLDAEYSDGSTRRITAEATWTSSNDHVATVVGGVVTGRNVGGAEVRVSYEELRVRFGFQVERGYHFTILNVAPNIIGSIEGTLENTGKDLLGEDWYVQAILYEDGRETRIAASEDREYREYNDYMFSGARKDFYIIPDTRDYDSYELRVVVGTQVAEYSGCQRRRVRDTSSNLRTPTPGGVQVGASFGF